MTSHLRGAIWVWRNECGQQEKDVHLASLGGFYQFLEKLQACCVPRSWMLLWRQGPWSQPDFWHWVTKGAVLLESQHSLWWWCENEPRPHISQSRRSGSTCLPCASLRTRSGRRWACFPVQKASPPCWFSQRALHPLHTPSQGGAWTGSPRLRKDGWCWDGATFPCWKSLWITAFGFSGLTWFCPES